MQFAAFGTLTPQTGSQIPLTCPLTLLAGSQSLLAGLQTPLAGPLSPLAGPQTLLAGTQSPLAIGQEDKQNFNSF